MNKTTNLMALLDGATPETVNKIAWEYGSLPVRLAMLELAAKRKKQSALWWGYPPGVFIGYKWDGQQMQDKVVELKKYIQKLGYRTFLDVEELNDDADAYFQIPKFIASLEYCTFYVLLLTELSADMIMARKGKTSWIYDEYQYACRLVNEGRLLMIPVLLEPKGKTDFFTSEMLLDLTSDLSDFGKLNNTLTPNPNLLSKTDITELESVVAQFDALFLDQQWEASDAILTSSRRFENTFDHAFRLMLHSLYTAKQKRFESAWNQLQSVYGKQIVLHFYKGYCERHNIPKRIQM